MFTSCEKVLYRAQPEVNNLNVFDDFSKIFNEKYAMFEQKGVDWPVLSDSVRATIDATTTEVELGQKMGYMVARLRDGHTTLEAADEFYGFDLLAGYEINLDINLLATYLAGGTEVFGEGEKILTSTLDDNVGYIFIEGFEGFTLADIDDALASVANTRGLIIDVRTNGGGDPNLAGDLARRFTATSYAAGTELFKTGPGANDFSPQEITVTPATDGTTYLDKKVAILQGRPSFSATTTLIYLTDPNPNVVTFGGFSGGGSGSVTSGYLINGWVYNLSSSDFVDARGRRLDDGVAPDFPVELDPTDAAKDEILEAAIAHILQ